MGGVIVLEGMVVVIVMARMVSAVVMVVIAVVSGDNYSYSPW